MIAAYIVLAIMLIAVFGIMLYTIYKSLKEKEYTLTAFCTLTVIVVIINIVTTFNSMHKAPITTEPVYIDTVPDSTNIQVVPITVGDQTIYVPVVVNDIEYD